MSKIVAELQVTIKTDKAEHFINTLSSILECECISREAEESIAALLLECFGIGKK